MAKHLIAIVSKMKLLHTILHSIYDFIFQRHLIA